MTILTNQSTKLPKLNKAQRAVGELTPDTIRKALNALQRYERRQLRLERPAGSFDNAKRWYPTKEEDQGVTDWAREPSRRFPFSYMSACRSLDHCCALEKVSYEVVLTVRRAIPDWKTVEFRHSEIIEELYTQLVEYTARQRLNIVLPKVTATSRRVVRL